MLSAVVRPAAAPVVLTRRRAPRRAQLLLPAASCLLLVSSVVLAAPALGLLATATAIASLLRRRFGAAAPVVSVLGLLVAATTAGLLAGFLGSSLAQVGSAVLLLQAALCLTAAAVASRAEPLERRASPPVLAAAPALLAIAVGTLQAVDVQRAASWGLVGTDIASHVLITGQLQEDGHLAYSEQQYPRALHALIAFATAVVAPSLRSVELLEMDLRTFCAVTWYSFGLLLWAAAWTGQRAAILRGCGPRAAVLAAAVPPWLLLGSIEVQEAQVYLGAAPALLAVALLWLLALPRPGTGQALLTCASVLLAVAHLWQPLVLVPVVVGAVHVWHSRRRLTSPRVAASAAGSVLLAAAALPALTSTTASKASDIAGYFGVLPAVPVVLVLSLVLALPTAAAWRSEPHAAALPALGLVVLVLTAMSGEPDLAQYYPRKGVWLLSLYALPYGVAQAVRTTTVHGPRLWSWLGGLPNVGRVCRRSLVLAAVVLAAAVVLPGLVSPHAVLVEALRGHLDTGQRRLELASAEYGPPGTQWLPSSAGLARHGGPTGSFVLSKLFSFRTGQEATNGEPAFLCDDLRTLSTTGGPVVVVTDVREDLLRRTAQVQGCAAADVVQVPGGYQPEVDAVEQVLRTLTAGSPS